MTINVTDSGPSIRQLTTAMANAEANAIARFYNEYFDLMFMEARRASRRDEQFCLDIVQDAMLKVIRSVRPMESESQLAQWTRRLVRNAAYDLLRTEIRRKNREANSASYRPGDRTRDELEEMEAQMTVLAAALKEIDASDNHLLSARYKWGWTLQRIGPMA